MRRSLQGIPALLFGLVIASSACGGSGAVANGSQTPKGADGEDGRDGPSTATPKRTAGGRPAEIDCGDFHCCVRTESAAVSCWGSNIEGQVGTRTESEASPTPVSDVEGVEELALGGTFSCARIKGGSVKCWGTGKLAGDGKLIEKGRPTTVEGIADAVQIEADGFLVCARLGSGAVKCWGIDDVVAPPLTDATDVKVAETHACALVKGGTVKCWGADGGWGRPPAPFTKPAIKDVEQLVAVDAAACALVKGGTVKCWGKNFQGELGIAADADDHVKPVTVPGISGAVGLMSGLAHVCALMPDGSAHCWGDNEHGELGRGTESGWEPAGPVSGVSGKIEEIAFGADHGCARTADAVYCWGSNTLGQLGDGTRDSRLLPKRVGF